MPWRQMGVSGVASSVSSSDGEVASEAGPAPCRHAVRFYSGELPADEVGGWLARRIAGGEAAVIIADRQHLAALSGALATTGLDLGPARASGQLNAREV